MSKAKIEKGDVVLIESSGNFPENILMAHFYNGKTGTVISVENYVCEVKMPEGETVYFRHESLTKITKPHDKHD